MAIATGVFAPRPIFRDLNEEDPLRDAHARVRNAAFDRVILSRLENLNDLDRRLQDLSVKIEIAVQAKPRTDEAKAKNEKQKKDLTKKWHKECERIKREDIPGFERLLDNKIYNVNKAIRKIPLDQLHYRDVDYIDERLTATKDAAREKFEKELTDASNRIFRAALRISAMLGEPLLIANQVPAPKPPARKINCNTVLADALTVSLNKTYDYVATHPLKCIGAGAATVAAAISTYHSDLITGLAPAAALASESLQIPLQAVRAAGSTLGSGFEKFIKAYFNAKTGAWLSGAATAIYALDPLMKIANHGLFGPPPAPAAGAAAPAQPAVNIVEETKKLSRTLLIGGANAAIPYLLQPGFIANNIAKVTGASTGIMAAGFGALTLSQSFNPHRPSLSIFFGEVSKALFTAAFLAEDILAGNQGFISDHPALSLLAAGGQLGFLALISQSQKMGVAAAAALAGSAYQAAGKGAAIGTAGIGAGLLAGLYLKAIRNDDGTERHPPIIPKIFGGGIALGGIGYGILEQFGKEAIKGAASAAVSQVASHPYIAAASTIGAAALTAGVATGRITRETVREWAETAVNGFTSNKALAGFAAFAVAGGTTIGNSKWMMGAGTLLFGVSATTKVAGMIFGRLFR